MGEALFLVEAHVRHPSDIDCIVCCTRRSFQEGYVCEFLEYLPKLRLNL